MAGLLKVGNDTVFLFYSGRDVVGSSIEEDGLVE